MLNETCDNFKHTHTLLFHCITIIAEDPHSIISSYNLQNHLIPCRVLHSSEDERLLREGGKVNSRVQSNEEDYSGGLRRVTTRRWLFFLLTIAINGWYGKRQNISMGE